MPSFWSRACWCRVNSTLSLLCKWLPSYTLHLQWDIKSISRRNQKQTISLPIDHTKNQSIGEESERYLFELCKMKGDSIFSSRVTLMIQTNLWFNKFHKIIAKFETKQSLLITFHSSSHQIKQSIDLTKRRKYSDLKL